MEPEPEIHGAGYLALSMRLTGRHCLVVGGSPFADYAQRRLRAAGATVYRVGRGTEAFDPDAAVVVLDEPFRPDMADGMALVVAATGTRDGDGAVAAAARERGVPVHADAGAAVGDARLASLVPQIGLQLALEGDWPEPVRDDVARRVAEALPLGYARLAGWVARHADTVATQVPDGARRRRFWQDLIQGWPAEAVLGGQWRSADDELQRRLASSVQDSPGAVYLIGAGPGDPDLMTVRAVRLLQQADVVLYDRLVPPGVLDLTPMDADRVYVGKRRSHHSVPQETINEMLIRYAEAGRCVVRLKGGDPFVFGRGGEEIDQLMERGVRFQVVPGVTAASGCAAYAGIPLTHRDHAQSCVFTTGHRRGDGTLEIDFEGLVRPAQTIVFYMGLAGLSALTEGLIAHGMRPDMPAALVQQGTTGNQRVVAGPLHALSALADEVRLRAPTLIIVGEVVGLRERLAWFEPQGDGGSFWGD